MLPFNIKAYKFMAKNWRNIAGQYSMLWRYKNIIRGFSEKKVLASSAQKRFYYQSISENNDTSTVIKVLYTYKGELNVKAYEEAFNRVIKNHSVFYTTFYCEKGNVYQIVNVHRRYKLDMHDFTDINTEAELRRSIVELARKPFDLEKLPLFKIHYIKEKKGKVKLLFCFHHTIIDGWSIYNLQKKISRIYKKIINSEKINYNEDPLQYVEYSYIENDNGINSSDEDLTFWHAYFKGLEPINLPFIKKNNTTRRSGHMSASIPPMIYERAKKIQQQSGVTLNTLMLATFFLLLHRYSHNETICVLMPRLSRFHKRLRSMMGPVLNSLPIICRFNENMCFNDILCNLNKTLNELIKHVDVPFEHIIEKLNDKYHLELSQEHFQIFYNYISPGWREVNTIENLDYQREEFLASESNNLMTFYMIGEKGEKTISPQITYQLGKISPDMTRSMLDQFILLLDQATHDIYKPITEFSLIPQTSKNIIPDLTLELPKISYENVSKMLIKAIEQYSSHMAIYYGTQGATYNDLLSHIKFIHHQIKYSDLKLAEPVIIYGERNKHFYAAIIAAMIAGHPFCLIDQNADIDNIRSRCQSASAKLAISSNVETPNAEINFLLAEMAIPLLRLDKDNSLDIMSTLDELKTDISTIKADDVAYIMFTSGSTAQPTMIQGTHNALAQFIHWQKNTFSICATDKCAQLTGYHFDVILREIFTPLCSGATVVIPENSDTVYSSKCLQWLNENNITVFHVVPSLMNVLIEQADGLNSCMLPAMRWIFFAGEPLSRNLIDKLSNRFYGCGKFVNLYGPSETTLAKAYYLVSEKRDFNVVPIGKSISDSQVFLMNSGQLCGPGELGEIVIRTPHATIIEHDDSTAQLFKKNPFRCSDNDDIYYTKDLGYLMPDGNIHILGRKDDQVKINGIRIDVSVITTAINSLSSIKEAYVTVANNDDSIATIVAHVVPATAVDITNFDELDFRHKLCAMLPAYMIPQHFNLMDKLPRLSSGKINKHELSKIRPKAPHQRLFSGRCNTIKNSTEKNLVAIFSEILKIDNVPTDVNFHVLGLTSLQIIDAVLTINERLSIHLDISSLIRFGSIEKLSEHIRRLEQSADGDDQSGAVAISLEELKRHAILPNLDILPTTSHQNIANKIFITGVTGFLGAYLVNAVARQYPSADLFCLVRAENDIEAYERLSKAFEKYQIDTQDIMPRLHVILGDLGKAKFGLSEQNFKYYAQEIDLIIHCAAHVNFLLDFETLAPANIKGTYNVIELAATNKLKPIHYISTAGIFPAREAYVDRKICESETIDFGDDVLIYGGYAQTKWVSEYMMQEAKQKKMPVSIYRLGRISGDSSTGYWPEHDFIFAFLKSILQTKVAPDLSISIDMMPVDHCAEFIARICRNKQNDNKIYHLVNPNVLTFSEIQSMLTKLGYKTDLIDYQEWLNVLLEMSRLGINNSLLPFLALFPSDIGTMPRLRFDRKFDVSNVRSVFLEIGCEFPRLDINLLGKYLQCKGGK